MAQEGRRLPRLQRAELPILATTSYSGLYITCSCVHSSRAATLCSSSRPAHDRQKFSCNPKHKNHLYTDNERFGIGGYAPNHLAIMLDDELMYGSSSATEAFGNPAFVEDDFRIRSVEVRIPAPRARCAPPLARLSLTLSIGACCRSGDSSTSSISRSYKLARLEKTMRPRRSFSALMSCSC